MVLLFTFRPLFRLIWPWIIRRRGLTGRERWNSWRVVSERAMESNFGGKPQSFCLCRRSDVDPSIQVAAP